MCAKPTLASEPGEIPELAWLLWMERGIAELRAKRLPAAETSWEKAHHISVKFDSGDPRSAATLNNLAVAAHFERRLAEAERLYGEASQAWALARRWVENMELPQRARSSTFHMRMEQCHRHHYENLAREQYRVALPVGGAVVANNQAHWHETANNHTVAVALYRQALQDRASGCQPPERGSHIIRNNLAMAEGHSGAGRPTRSPGRTIWASVVAEPFVAQAEREGWIVDRPPVFTDEGRFMAGLACACLIERV